MSRSPQHPGRSRRSVPLGAVACLTAGAAAVLALVVAPPDALQGQSQRLMYLHVPAAWTAFVAFGVVSVASIATLLGARGRWDALGQAAAELGVAMTALTLLEGSIWGHVAWGVWWTWDPRLVSTALLFLLYVGYLAARALPGEAVRVRRRAAVVGAVAFVQVPVVHFSVLYWRTLHQPPTLLRPDVTSAPIAAPMLAALLAGVLAFSVSGVWFVRRRVQALTDTGHASGIHARPAPDLEEASSPVAGTAPAAGTTVGSGV